MNGPEPVGLLQAFLERFCPLEEAVAQKASELTAQWLAIRGSGDADRLFSVCESPMERMFLLGLVLTGSCFTVDSFPYEKSASLTDADGNEYYLIAQAEQYDPDDAVDSDDPPFARVDFVLRAKDHSARLAIEVDGHEFHEKTKEQAARDKSRDRKLVRLGFHVLRFSGSEVFASPVGCWKEIENIVGALRADLLSRFEMLRDDSARLAPPQLEAPAAASEAAE